MQSFLKKPIVKIMLILILIGLSLIFLYIYQINRDYSNALKPIRVSQKQITQFREFYKKQREYDLELNHKNVNFISYIWGSNRHQILLMARQSTNNADNGKNEGLWISHDQGVSWQRSMNGIRKPDEPIYQIIEDEPRNRFYLATGDGVYQSRDLGRTWKRFSEGLPWEHRQDLLLPAVYKLSINSLSGELYARVPIDGFGIYKTGWRKPDWQAIGGGLPEESITTDVCFSPTDQAVYIINGCSGAIVIGGYKLSTIGVFKGTRLQKNRYRWAKEHNLPDETYHFEPIHQLMTDPNTGGLYASTYLGLYHKTQGKWQLIFNRHFVGTVAFESGTEKRVLVTTPDQLYLGRKSQAGLKWRMIKNLPWNKYATIGQICFFNRVVYVVTNDGLYLSRDHLQHWERVKVE